MRNRVEFFSGLVNNTGILKEYIDTHYEIAAFLYNCLGKSDDDVSVVNYDDSSMTVKFIIKNGNYVSNKNIEQYLLNFNGHKICDKVITISSTKVENDYVIAKISSMS